MQFHHQAQFNYVQYRSITILSRSSAYTFAYPSLAIDVSIACLLSYFYDSATVGRGGSCPVMAVVYRTIYQA